MANHRRKESNFINYQMEQNVAKESEQGFKRKLTGLSNSRISQELQDPFDKQSDDYFNTIDLETIEKEMLPKKVKSASLLDQNPSLSPKILKIDNQDIINTNNKNTSKSSTELENCFNCESTETADNVGNITVEQLNESSTDIKWRISGIIGEINGMLVQNLYSQCKEETSIQTNRSLDASVLKDTILENLHSNGRPSFLNSTFNNDIFSDSFLFDFQSDSQPNFFGLPIEIKTLLQTHKGIEDLYEWQKQCMNLSALQERKNIILSVPTSGGKTLIAELLILKELICRRCDALLILPYISIVQEKVRDMSSFAVDLNFAVEEYAGSKGKFPPKQKRKRSTIYMATIEKGHSLINSLIEEKRLGELGVVIIDEFHMIGEGGSRGAVLESLLTKLLFLSDNIQIIGMSATLGNIEDLQKFLNADIYCHTDRPVELKEYIKVNEQIMEFNAKSNNTDELFKLVRQFKFLGSEKRKAEDPDCLAGLVAEVIPDNSCLVFCPTKQNCENVALLICSGLSREIKQNKEEKKTELISALQAEGNGNLCNILQKTIPYGVAYHHSGLTMDERRLLEEGYSLGTLCCLTCTSTLAAGVNLPARRVILRSPYIGTQFITRNKYKQMIGRAGRAGIDDSGESILIIKPSNFNEVLHMMKSPEEQCLSSLFDEKTKGIETLLLSIIGLKIAVTINDLDKFLNCTLLAVQKDCFHIDIIKLREKAVENLISKCLIEFIQTSDEDEKHLSVTKLGIAVFKGSINIDIANQLHNDLAKNLQNLVLHNYLQLLYLVTPYDAVAAIQPQISIYYKMYMKLCPNDAHVAEVIGLPESHIALMAAGKQPKKLNKEIFDRFYLTLILYHLWNKYSIWNVANEFHLHRGVIQNLISGANAFASSVYHFCEELPEFWAYKLLLEGLIHQLQYCVTPELLPLMELPAVKRGRAVQLYKAGYKSLQDLTQADINHLIKNIPHMSRRTANQIIAAAKMLIIDKVIELKYQAEDLMLGKQTTK